MIAIASRGCPSSDVSINVDVHIIINSILRWVMQKNNQLLFSI